MRIKNEMDHRQIGGIMYKSIFLVVDIYKYVVESEKDFFAGNICGKESPKT